MKAMNMFMKAVTVMVSLHMAYKASQNKRKYDLTRGDVDTNNVVNSMFGARPLYKKLITVTHPDRWVNSPLRDQMEGLSAKITQHRYNHEMLQKLESEFNNIKKEIK